jgi:hypothetical protein
MVMAVGAAFDPTTFVEMNQEASERSTCALFLEQPPVRVMLPKISSPGWTR